jgi:NIMA (never in mitosis gene a)-related kinase
VSKIMSGTGFLQATRVGTPLYLSPEIVKQLPYDFKVDIWAVGCCIYHLATFKPPFNGDNLISLGNNIIFKDPQPLSKTYIHQIILLDNIQRGFSCSLISY